MAKGKAQEEISVEALLSVSSSEGVEEIRTFDKAWHRARTIARTTTPVKISFLRFVRKDK